MSYDCETKFKLQKHLMAQNNLYCDILYDFQEQFQITLDGLDQQCPSSITAKCPNVLKWLVKLGIPDLVFSVKFQLK